MRHSIEEKDYLDYKRKESEHKAKITFYSFLLSVFITSFIVIMISRFIHLY